MIAYYGLYNTAFWQIVLAEQGAPPGRTFGVVSDPRDPACWKHFDAATFDMEMSWMVAPVAGTGERVARSLAVAFEQRTEAQRTGYLGTLFKETMTDCGIRYGDKITPEFITRFSYRVALWWTGATFEERLTPAQLQAALTLVAPPANK